MHKAPGHPVTDRDAVLALTTPEMASMRPDVLCTISLHAIREALERNDWVAAVAAAHVLLDRAPQSIEAPVAVAVLAADADSHSNGKLAAELRQRLASQYAPGSEWAASLRKSRPQGAGEADIRFAQSLGEGAKEAMVAPEELTILKGNMPPLHRAEPRLEEQVRLLVDHCLFPFGDKPIHVSLSVVGLPPAEPGVTVREAAGLPAPVAECLQDDAFAYLRQLPAQPMNVEVK
jgi:hypothetical protein